MKCCFYDATAAQVRGKGFELSPDYSFEYWKPKGVTATPPQTGGKAFRVWALIHALRLFYNRDYGVMLIRNGGKVVHRSCVFPGWFRFPFMARADLQVGDTWTDPDHRGKGLAAAALAQVLASEPRPDRRFWYVVEEENVSSIRVAEKVGFRMVGTGGKRKRLGLGLLGYYGID